MYYPRCLSLPMFQNQQELISSEHMSIESNMFTVL